MKTVYILECSIKAIDTDEAGVRVPGKDEVIGEYSKVFDSLGAVACHLVGAAMCLNPERQVAR